MTRACACCLWRRTVKALVVASLAPISSEPEPEQRLVRFTTVLLCTWLYRALSEAVNDEQRESALVRYLSILASDMKLLDAVSACTSCSCCHSLHFDLLQTALHECLSVFSQCC